MVANREVRLAESYLKPRDKVMAGEYSTEHVFVVSQELIEDKALDEGIIINRPNQDEQTPGQIMASIASKVSSGVMQRRGLDVLMAVEGITIDNQNRPTRPEDFILGNQIEQDRETAKAIMQETGEYPEGWAEGPGGEPIPLWINGDVPGVAGMTGGAGASFSGGGGLNAGGFATGAEGTGGLSGGKKKKDDAEEPYTSPSSYAKGKAQTMLISLKGVTEFGGTSAVLAEAALLGEDVAPKGFKKGPGTTIGGIDLTALTPNELELNVEELKAMAISFCQIGRLRESALIEGKVALLESILADKLLRPLGVGAKAMPIQDVWTLAQELKEVGEALEAEELEKMAARLDEASMMRLETEVAERLAQEDLQARAWSGLQLLQTIRSQGPNARRAPGAEGDSVGLLDIEGAERAEEAQNWSPLSGSPRDGKKERLALLSPQSSRRRRRRLHELFWRRVLDSIDSTLKPTLTLSGKLTQTQTPTLNLF